MLLLVGCAPLFVVFPGERDPPVAGEPDLALSLLPEQVEATLGAPTTLSLVVENNGTGVAEASVEVVEEGVGVWTVTPATLDIAPGRYATSSVRLTPEAWGDASVEFVVTDQHEQAAHLVVSVWVYEDGDADGHASLRSGGDDCDDADPDTHPGAPEVWYDGVDSDCLGGDDYDQDADGVQVDLDCDDGNAAVSAATDEVWNGVDDDCDGLIDNLEQAGLGDPWVAGNISELGVGSVGSWYTDAGLFGGRGDPEHLWLVPASHVEVDITTTATGVLSAPSGVSFTATSPHAAADVVLVVAGERGEVWGAPLVRVSGDVAVVDVAILHFLRQGVGLEIVAADLGDVDGDGIADCALGIPTADGVDGGDDEEDEDGAPAAGAVLLFEGGLVGDLDLDDADEGVRGDDVNDLLGTTLSLQDVDDDGHADLLLGAPGVDEGDTQAGAVNVVLGQNNPNWRSTVSDESVGRILGDSYGASLGERPPAPAADLDGDGALDLVVPAPSAGAVAWFAAIGSLHGDVLLAEAEHRWTGDVGLGEAVAVVSLDGVPTLALGAPDSDVGGWVTTYAWDGASFLPRARILGDEGASLGAGLLAVPGGLLVGATGADDRAADGGAWWLLDTD